MFINFFADYVIIKRSGLFKDEYYLMNYDDVRQEDINQLWHYIKFGWREGRNPSNLFNTEEYLTEFPDLMKLKINPLVHYIKSLQKINKKPALYRRADRSTVMEEEGVQRYFKAHQANTDKIQGETDSPPVISVIVMSYNQKAYIKQCLDSILDQRGNFKMEVILGDDESTDGTVEILQEYVGKYPDNLFLLPRQNNLGYVKNFNRCIDACSGDYIAFCDGDDYWNDTNKLQKQLECLQKHPDYSMCFSAIQLFYQEEGRFALHQGQQSYASDRLSTEDIIKDNIIANFSCCFFRSETITNLPQKLFDLDRFADYIVCICCAEMGPIGFIKEVMSVYRIHSGGAWSGSSLIANIKRGLPYLDKYDSLLNYKYHGLFVEIKDRAKMFLKSQ